MKLLTHTFEPGETLTAEKLNKSFAEIDEILSKTIYEKRLFFTYETSVSPPKEVYKIQAVPKGVFELKEGDRVRIFKVDGSDLVFGKFTPLFIQGAETRNLYIGFYKNEISDSNIFSIYGIAIKKRIKETIRFQTLSLKAQRTGLKEGKIFISVLDEIKNKIAASEKVLFMNFHPLVKETFFHFEVPITLESGKIYYFCIGIETVPSQEEYIYLPSFNWAPEADENVFYLSPDFTPVEAIALPFLPELAFSENLAGEVYGKIIAQERLIQIFIGGEEYKRPFNIKDEIGINVTFLIPGYSTLFQIREFPFQTPLGISFPLHFTRIEEFADHSIRHEAGGLDEISIKDLKGIAFDPQKVRVKKGIDTWDSQIIELTHDETINIVPSFEDLTKKLSLNFNLTAVNLPNLNFIGAKELLVRRTISPGLETSISLFGNFKDEEIGTLRETQKPYFGVRTKEIHLQSQEISSIISEREVSIKTGIEPTPYNPYPNVSFLPTSSVFSKDVLCKENLTIEKDTSVIGELYSLKFTKSPFYAPVTPYLQIGEHSVSNFLGFSPLWDNGFGFKSPYKVYLINIETKEKTDITDLKNWKLLTDNTISEIKLADFLPSGVHKGRIRFEFNIGMWQIMGLFVSLVYAHFPYIEDILIEMANDANFTVHLENLYEYKGSIWLWDGRICFPLKKFTFRPFIAIEFTFSREGRPEALISLREIQLLAVQTWADSRFLGSLIPLEWDYKENIFIRNNLGIGTKVPEPFRLNVIGDVSLGKVQEFSFDVTIGYHPSPPGTPPFKENYSREIGVFEGKGIAYIDVYTSEGIHWFEGKTYVFMPSSKDTGFVGQWRRLIPLSHRDYVENDFDLEVKRLNYESHIARYLLRIRISAPPKDGSTRPKFSVSIRTQNLTFQKMIGDLQDENQTIRPTGDYIEFSISHQGGKIGIGTASPTVTLDIVSKNPEDGVKISGSGSNSPGLLFSSPIDVLRGAIGLALEPGHWSPSSAINDLIIRNKTNLLFATGENYLERMRISSDGRIAIGTTELRGLLNISNPITSLTDFDNLLTLSVKIPGTHASHIGWGKTGDWYIRPLLSTGKVVIADTGGNVGIGTSSPEPFKLNVVGNAYFEGSVGIGTRAPEPFKLAVIGDVAFGKVREYYFNVEISDPVHPPFRKNQAKRIGFFEGKGIAYISVYVGGIHWYEGKYYIFMPTSYDTERYNTWQILIPFSHQDYKANDFQLEVRRDIRWDCPSRYELRIRISADPFEGKASTPPNFSFIIRTENLDFTKDISETAEIVSEPTVYFLENPISHNRGCVGIGTPPDLDYSLYVRGKTKIAAFSQNNLIVTGTDGISYCSDWPSGWGGGIATWDICCASIYYGTLIKRSTITMKKNIKSLSELQEKISEKIDKLNPILFEWKESEEYKEIEGPNYGLITEEVEPIFPLLVDKNSKGLKMDEFIPILIKAIQEQNEEIAKIKEKIRLISSQ